MGRLGALIQADPRQPVLTIAPTGTVNPLQALQPGVLPTVTNPIETGYANPEYAEALQDFVAEKSAELNAARAAEAIAQAQEISRQNMTAAAIGAGAVLLIVKFLL